MVIDASWMELQDLRQKRTPTVPNQLASRLEDQLKSLKVRGYKHQAVKEQFEKVLKLSRETVLRKVSKSKKEDRLILSIPYDRRMPNISSILHLFSKAKSRPEKSVAQSTNG